MPRFLIDQWHFWLVREEKPREIAARILMQRQQGIFVENLLEAALRRQILRPEDRRFLQELVYGVVRWELTLDWLITQKTGGKSQKPIVQQLLRLALYQMFWLDRVPSYAAVNETVEIAKGKGLHRESKFINAVLRGYSREAEATRAQLAEFRSTNLALGYSHPEWLCSRWEQRWGREETVRLLEWNNTPPPTYARVNTLKTTAEMLLETWRTEGVEFESAEFDWVPPGTLFRLVGHPALSQLPSFAAGLFYIQDPSTLLAVQMLQAQKGEAILDLCAAPGGKTTYIAQRLENQAKIVARDLDDTRLKLVRENAERLGATCIHIAPKSSDAAAGFDRVLVDAPCSNTGVMRRRVELRWRIRPDEIQRLALTQIGILKEAAKGLRPGGIILYSTCSLEREENQAVVREFISADSSFTLEAERELTPFTDLVDGAYCARLLHRG